MYIFLYAILILFGLIGCVRKNSKIFPILVFIFAIIIVYMHPYCPDYKNYENVYYKIAAGTKYYDTGLGWYYICLFFTKLGISFRVFKTILCTISLLLINSTLKKYLSNKDQRYFWVIYLIFPLLLQCIQFRFMNAVALIIFGMQLLLNNNTKNKLLLLLIIILASSIHSSLLIILAMYFFLLIKPFKKHVKKIALLALITIAYLFIFHQDILIKIISQFINEVRIQRYFTMYNSANNIRTILLDITAILINYIPLNAIIKKLSKEEKKELENKYSVLELNSKMNFLFIVIIPFLVLDNNFIRVLEILIMLTNLSLLVLNEKGFKWKISTYKLMFINVIIYFMIFIPKYVILSSMLT